MLERGRRGPARGGRLLLYGVVVLPLVDRVVFSHQRDAGRNPMGPECAPRTAGPGRVPDGSPVGRLRQHGDPVGRTQCRHQRPVGICHAFGRCDGGVFPIRVGVRPDLAGAWPPGQGPRRGTVGYRQAAAAGIPDARRRERFRPGRLHRHHDARRRPKILVRPISHPAFRMESDHGRGHRPR